MYFVCVFSKYSNTHACTLYVYSQNIVTHMHVLCTMHYVYSQNIVTHMYVLCTMHYVYSQNIVTHMYVLCTMCYVYIVHLAILLLACSDSRE